MTTYVCPHCDKSIAVCTAEATVGHRCPKRRNLWTWWLAPAVRSH